jgi:RHS repeat-associated protein
LGQYEDIETGLYYNRFRYYSPDSGTYISQDPIGLSGNNPNLYAYTHDSNSQIDPFGLSPIGGWNDFLKATKGTFNKASNALSGSGDGNFMKDAASGWKEYVNSVNTTNLPAIGRLPDTAPLKGLAGNNILSTNRWSLEVNDAWLQGGIDSGKNVNLATNPIHKRIRYAK